MKIAEKLKRRAGFTLVELCIVMAVMAIIGTMVTTFIVYSANQKAEITKEAKCIEEITEVQKKINAWIRNYDSSTYNISVSSGNLNSSNGTNTYTLTPTSIVDGLKYVTGVSFERPKYFTKVNNVDTQVPEQFIKATVSYEGGKTQTLIFPLFSNITRSRKVEGRIR